MNIETSNKLGVSHKKALEIVEKYVVNNITKMHLLETEAIMRALARHFDENEEEWGIIGLLHDIDWDQIKNEPKEHTIKGAEILKKEGGNSFLIQAVESHCYGNEECGNNKDKERSTKLEHCLAAAETLTGLIISSALVQPDKKLSSVKLESLKKKFKTKSFAANCNRGIILECEKARLELDKFLEVGLLALREISNQLGL